MHLNKNIRLLAWFNFFLNLCFYVPILIIYFAHVTGSYTLGMSIFAVTSISNALFELPTGVFSDFIGRKRTLVLGAVASVGTMTFYAIGGSYFWLALGATCQGLAWALFSGNNTALLHDTLTALGRQDEYQEHRGRTTSFEYVGLALGSIIGGVLATISLSLVMWLSVIPQVINVVISLRMVEPGVSTRPTGNPYAHLRDAIRLIIQSHDLRQLSIASVLGGAIGESGYQLRAVFIAQLWPLWALGVARTLENALAAVGFFFSGRLIKRFTEFKLLIGGGLIGWIVDMVSIAFPTPLSPASMSLMSVFHGTSTVSQDSLFQQRFTTEQRATLGSLVALGGSLLFAVVSLGTGALADRLGVVAALLILKTVSIVSLWFIWRVYRRRAVTVPVGATDSIPDHLTNTDHIHAN